MAPRNTASTAVRSAAPAWPRRAGGWRDASRPSQSCTVCAAKPAHGPAGSTSDRA